MNYRLIAIDLDGTLLNSQHKIQATSLEALARARAQGVEVMIVTGRHHTAAEAYWHQLELTLPAICCNGSYVYDFKKDQALPNASPLSRDNVQQLLKLVRKHELHALIYLADEMACEEMSPYLPHLQNWAKTLPDLFQPGIICVESFESLIECASIVWKFSISNSNLAVMKAFVAEVQQRLGLVCQWSGTAHLDIMRAQTSKGRRLIDWVDHNAFSFDEVIAFGDQQNDLDMLQMAGFGVAMGNAIDELKDAADWVTGDNNSDGIASALNRFVFKKIN